MIVETERLTIAEATLEDCEFFFQLMNSENWLKHIGDRGINNYEDAEAYIQKSLIDSYKTNGFGLYKVTLKENQEPVGINGFVKRDYLKHPDIGFATLPNFEGQGYTHEAAVALLRYGKQTLKIDPILGITSTENIASQRLLKKVGLSYQKTVKSSTDGEELLLYST